MSMKFTVTEEREYPTKEEIKEAAQGYNPIKPKAATFITVFVDNCAKEVFRLMKANFGGYDRNAIALDVAYEYLKANGIELGVLSVVNVAEFPTHFVIEAVNKY